MDTRINLPKISVLLIMVISLKPRLLKDKDEYYQENCQESHFMTLLITIKITQTEKYKAKNPSYIKYYTYM